MKHYAAPLEGMTNDLWRRIHADTFGGADRYFTPFVSPNATCKFQTKELNELQHNEGLPVIPQILTNSAQHFLWAAREMADMGYAEVNFMIHHPLDEGIETIGLDAGGSPADGIAAGERVELGFARAGGQGLYQSLLAPTFSNDGNFHVAHILSHSPARSKANVNSAQ